ncbi:MAG TPA: bifunctional class I SAM-dependent methyltransferase/NUDIX hydrolase [Chloroflexota bacterium]|nr:bifunctional class I SAM-dependent methyltransferase/NUDIX hydrolase [Chloroflexota bacterium]
MTDDPTIATYDRIAPAFADCTYGISLDPAREMFGQRIRLNARAERFRILDAGCGPGRDCKWFFERGFQVCGIDLSAGMLAEARRRVPNVEFHIADLRQLDFPDGHFDGIWCCASLLHLPLDDWPGVLASFNQLLGHGYLYLAVKQGEGEEVVESSYGAGTPRHFTYVQRPELELLLERAGFDIHEVSEGTSTAESPHPWLSFLAQTKLRTPLLASIAYIFDGDGRLLLSERVDGRGWNPPCGFVDRHEAPNEAVHREVREETGLEIELDRFIGIYTGPRTYRGVLNESHLALHAFTARCVGGVLAPTNEALQHDWFDPDHLPSPMASLHHAEILQDVLAVRSGQLTAPIVRRYRIARWSDLGPDQNSEAHTAQD